MNMRSVTSDPTLARLFIPICKIDEEQRLVYGKMTFEGTDSAGEIWDYEGSKPYFEKWSENAEKTSGGKSLGNLRSMHQPIAAGKLTQFVLDDETKSVHICGKVVDDAEWDKVLEGVYTGFSQGGRYVKRWKDESDSTKTRYISDPVEVSLVDLPCLPGAEFEYVKADGTVELRKFSTNKETPMYEPTNEEVAARATHIAKSAGGAWTDHIETAVAELKAEHASKAAGGAAPAAEPTAPAPAAEASGEAAAAAEDDANKAKGAKDPAGSEAGEEDDGEGNSDDDPKNDEETEEADDAEKMERARKAARDSLVQVWLTPEQQALLGKSAFVKAADAVSAIVGDEEPAPSPVAAALAAAKSAASGEPVMARFEPTEGLDVAKATLGSLCEKGLWTAGRALDVLDSVISLQCSTAWEAEYEKDGSSVPAQLAEVARTMGDAALALCQEEIAEALAGLQASGEVEVETLVANAAEAEFVKGVLGSEELMKIGARNSASDRDRIQKIHDNSVDLGADCASADEAADKLAKAAESSPLIKSLIEDRELLKTQVSEAVEGIGELAKTITTMREEIKTLKSTPAPMAPRTSVVGKREDAADGASAVEKTAAEATISELMKTEQGRAQLADAAIRAAQSNGLTI